MACLSARGQAFTFVSSTTFSPAYNGGAFRGLSGIDYVPGQGWYVVSDRGGSRTRVNEGNIFLTDKLPPDTDARQLTPKAMPFSLESIRYDARRDLVYLSAERDSAAAGEQDSTVVLALKRSELGNPAQAVRLLSWVSGSTNKGVEGLAITPSGQLWVAPEAGWAGETAMTNPTVHFLRYKEPAPGNVPDSISYPIDRFPNAYYRNDKPGGIAELLAIDDSTLLVLERAYHVFLDQDQGKREVVLARLYRAQLDAKTGAFAKTEVFNFNDPNQFSDGIRNLEGMAWGPASAEGKRRLYIVADDNFEYRPERMTTQKNQLIILETR
ncbi:esterase-like activity of phytase family protein [Fibrella aestuarina]|uniref:esterase-like activity of phytase family protein n=1 Tax=Fibrella aestuarina TaxID=651143 RepID=UPI00030A9C72|nr:esterase-like activity of phytase family protein [Fibrella aestuarina]